MSGTKRTTACLHWGVLGGGLMGLVVALRLAQAGQKVTVLEAKPDLGGLASAWRLLDFTWDRHYHVTLLSDERLRCLLEELGIEESIRWVETKTGFLTDGKLYSMSNSWEFLTFPPLSLWEKSRLALTILHAARVKDGAELEKIQVAEWLRKWSGRGVFQKIWLPLLKAKLGDAYQRVSAAFIWTTINRMYRARRSGLKKEMFGYVPGGYAVVLDRLRSQLEELGVEVRTACPVRRVEAEQGGRVRVAYESGDAGSFDKAVLTAPSSRVGRMCPDLQPEERARHDQVEYLGILCASLVLKSGLDRYYVTNITESEVPFTAVIEMTALVDPAELGGRRLVYLPRYVTADDEAWAWSDDELQERFLQALERLYPDFSRDDLLAFRVSRVKEVMALPTLEYSRTVPPTRTTLDNLFVVNSAQITKGTLNVNEVIEVAENAIEDHLLPSLQSHAPKVNRPHSAA